MRTYTLPYGHGSQTVSLDEGRVLGVIELPQLPPVPDVARAVLDAVNANPIGAPPLAERVKPGDTVTFICNDPTRVANTFEFMPVLVQEMNRLGVPDENMQVVFSLGTHRKMSEAEMREHLTDDLFERLKTFNSDCNAPEDFEYFGATSRFTPVLINKLVCHSDHVILTGSIVYHFFAGYGGGRKAVLPGCAAMETIRHNHSLMLDPGAGLGKTTGNPVYEDQLEGVALWAAAMRRRGSDVFLFNAVLDDKHRFLKMFAGDYVKAHVEACKFVDEVYGAPIKQQADIVIASCGGYPKDINIYQSQKTMDNAVLAVKEGGVVILLAECVEGSGSAPLEAALRRLKTPEAIKREVAAKFIIGEHKAFSITRPMGRARFIIVSGMDEQLGRDMLFTAVKRDVNEALALAGKLLGDDKASVILMPAGSLTVPRVAD